MIDVIILAAGYSKRFGLKTPKQFFKLKGKTILEHSIEKFLFLKPRIICALPEKYIDFKIPYNVIRVKGGKTRAESVVNAANFVIGDVVLIHDAARCFVSQDVIKRVLIAAKKYGASIPVINPVDTIKICINGFVKKTLPKEITFNVQTPQGFKKNIFFRIVKYMKKNPHIPDDSYACEKLGIRIKIVEGDVKNKKITYIHEAE